MSDSAPIRFARTHQRELMVGASFALLLFTLVFNLTHSPLWGDEWEELSISQRSLFDGSMYESIISTFQPPLYNFVMHLWLKVNQSMLWFRGFNVLIGMASGFFLWRTVRRLAGEAYACLAVGCLACSYEWVYCMQECSEYGLMLFCLFTALDAFVGLYKRFSRVGLVQFVLGCAGAMYSQYGAAFVVMPAIVMLPLMLYRKHGRGALLELAVAYGIALVVFVWPLYNLFFRHQLGNMQGGRDQVSLSLEMVVGAPFMLGQILGFFFHQTGGVWTVLWSAVSVVLLAGLVRLLMVGKPWEAPQYLALGLLIAYALHYPLVQLHIYAMVHPGQSYGFFCRYSYFYLPLMAMLLPVLASRAKELMPQNASERIPAASGRIALGCAALVLAFSFVPLLRNWHKSYDDEFARIWAERKGYDSTTYLLGAHADDGARTYLPQQPGYSEAWLARCTTSVNTGALPASFWVWHSNWDWGAEGFGELVNSARAMGYSEVVYAHHDDPIDYNNYWTLSYFER